MNKTAMSKVVRSRSLMQKGLMPVLAITVLLLMVAWLAGSFDKKIMPGLVTNTAVNTAKENSESFIVTYSNETELEPVAASITAKQASIISSQILATIVSINVRSGDTIKIGTPLIELEKGHLISQVSRANENINALQARHQEAEKNLVRAKTLLEQKLISVFDLDKSKADFQSIDGQLKAAQQTLKQAQVMLTYATLTSPINGLVVDRFAEPGNTAQPGTKLLSLYNPLSLQIAANIREQLALTLVKGQNLTVELPSINKALVATIEEIVPAANTRSRSFLVKASIDFNEGYLPGMYGRMFIPTQVVRRLYVPKDKLTRVGQLDFIWLEVNGELQRRFVRLGKDNTTGMVSVISGLNEGDIIVTPPNSSH